MQVAVDQIWCTPSTLHMRVVVWGPNREWRHKYYSAIPLSDVPEEVIISLYQHWLDDQPSEDLEDIPLF